jgi:hypothetical protein
MAETTDKKPGDGTATLRGNESDKGHPGQNPGIGQPHESDDERKADGDDAIERDDSANPGQRAERGEAGRGAPGDLSGPAKDPYGAKDSQGV